MSSHQHNGNLCNNRLVIHWLGGLALCALAVAAGLAVTGRGEPTIIVTIAGVTVSVASGFIGHLSGRAAQNTVVNTDQANVSSGGGAPSPANVETLTMEAPAADAAPTEEDPAVTRGGTVV